MQILKNFELNQQKNSVVTIGNFDGIHLGHKKLINTTKKIALEKSLNSIVFSFIPHPLEVLKNQQFLYIFTQEEKKRVLLKEGIDIFLNCPFDKHFANLSPNEFIDLILNKLNCSILVVGEDYCFGKNREGNIEVLKKIGVEKGIKVIKIPDVIFDGERVSSSKIRECIVNKNIQKANTLLNREYFVLGNVSEGNKLGRTIGFPTANIIPEKNKLLPPDGVYITKTLYEGKYYESITNIGKNPTINNTLRTIETHIFDFNQNIYGKEIQVLFLEWVRDVKKFSSLDELKQQIAKDINKTNQFFEYNKKILEKD